MKRLLRKIKGGQKTQSGSKKKLTGVKTRLRKPSLSVSTAGIKAATVLGVLVLAVGVFLWSQFIFLDQERVFQDMLKNTLKTQSVTRVIEQDFGLQQLEQISRLHLGGQAVVSGQTTITQTGTAAAEVVTEDIGTPERDFVRYTKIDTSEESADGSDLDFSEIIGIWGVSEPQPGQEGSTVGEAYSEATLGVLPFANISPTDQARLYDYTQETQMYKIDYLGITEGERNGRTTYIYPVSLQPEPYVTYLQQLAELQGLTQLEGVNPAQFRNVSPVRIIIEIDVLSRQPVSIEYGEDERQETLRDFGLLRTVDIPQLEDTVPATTLQQRLQSVR